MAAGVSSSRSTRTQVSRTRHPKQPFGQELQDHQVAVLVRHQAGQLVGLAEAEPAGSRSARRAEACAGNRRAQPEASSSSHAASSIASRETSRSAICEEGL
jgi:hypothetical protein